MRKLGLGGKLVRFARGHREPAARVGLGALRRELDLEIALILAANISIPDRKELQPAVLAKIEDLRQPAPRQN